MPRVSDIQTNFTGGEFSPRLAGRVDVDRYRNAAATLENVIVHVQGGVVRRPGMRFVAKAKHDNKRAVLLPYVFSETQAYIIELGDAYLRVFKSDGTQVMAGSVPYEVQTDYAEADVADIQTVQGADTMFLMHGLYPTARLRRFGDAAWVWDNVPWIVEPFDEIGTTPDTTLAIDDATVGTGRTLTAGIATFLAADVGRTVSALGGLCKITAVPTTTTATVDVVTAMPATTFAAGEWTIQGSPLTTLTSDLAEPSGYRANLTLSAAGWRDDDVGKWVSINGGLIQIISVTSTTAAVGVIHKALSSDVGAQAYAWILQAGVWGGYNGHPRTGTLYQQRLCLAGSPGFPQTVWGSRIGEYYNFELGTLDDDAFAFNVASDQLNPVINLTQLKVLVALTYGGEFTLAGGNDAALAPTNVQIRNQSNYGCNGVAAERIGNELMFVQRGSRKVRGMSEDKIVTSQYGAPDISILSNHVTESGVVGLTYAAEPDSVLWCVRNDGVLATCTIDRDQNVVAWTRQVTDGVAESVATIPGDDGDQVWVLVKRTINGVDVRQIERFEDGVMTDAASIQTDAVGKTTWDGLDHLEGCTVTVKGDGVHMADRVVTGGAITVERAVKQLEAGLPYLPKVVPLRPALGSQQGTSQASNIRVHQVILRVRDTTGVTVNGAPLISRQVGQDVLDQLPPAVTGDVPLDTLGWDIGKWDMTIEQPLPYAFNLLAIITHVTVNA